MSEPGEVKKQQIRIKIDGWKGTVSVTASPPDGQPPGDKPKEEGNGD